MFLISVLSVYKCPLIDQLRAICFNLLGFRLDVFTGLRFESDVKIAKLDQKCTFTLHVCLLGDNYDFFLQTTCLSMKMHPFSCDGISECYLVEGSFYS